MTAGIDKAATGIEGFDDITLGGLPRGRPSLVCGSAGCGKTLFAATFLVNGVRAGEPGVFVSFEERPKDIVENVASLGFALDSLVEEGKIVVEHVAIDPAEIAYELGVRLREGCKAMPDPTPMAIFDHVYSEMTDELATQRDGFAAYLDSFEGAH